MALALDGVTRVVRGQVHIHPTDLTLDKGTMNVLLGPTLAGKTTLMRLMAGLDRPTEGRILWHGADVTGMRGAGPQGGDGLPAVHQLPDDERLREHRLAAAHPAPARRPRSTAPCARPRRCSS